MLPVLLATVALLAAPGPRPASAHAGPHLLDVNCDAGERLDDALLSAKGVSDVTVIIHGTCRGRFAIENADGLGISGIWPEVPILEPSAGSGSGPVVEVRNSRRVELGNLIVRNSDLGVIFRNCIDSGVRNTQVLGGSLGMIFFECGSGFVDSSDVQDSTIGVDVWRSEVQVWGSRIHNNLLGVVATNNSTLSVVFGEISGNLTGGVSLNALSTLDASGCTLRDNGDYHVAANGGSRVQEFSSALGAAGDRTWLSVFLAESTFNAVAEHDLFGAVYATLNSFLALVDVTVHGDVVVDGFSKAVLTDPTFSTLTCSRGGDVVCSPRATVPTSGCATTSACGSSATAPPSLVGAERYAEVAARIRDFVRGHDADLRARLGP